MPTSVTRNTLENELAMREFATALQQEEAARIFFASQRQQRLARELGRNRKSIDGLGRPKAEIDNDVYMFWVMKLGRQCWKDPGFLRWFHNNHPETRVEAKGTRIQSGYGGLTANKGKRFSKTYNFQTPGR